MEINVENLIKKKINPKKKQKKKKNKEIVVIKPSPCEFLLRNGHINVCEWLVLGDFLTYQWPNWSDRG